MKIGLTSAGRLPAPDLLRALAETHPRAKKKERNSAETRRRILDAAAGEFAAKGFDGARLGSIARTADVQQALIHHYFGDKDGLHAEVVRAGLTSMTEGVWALLSRMDATAPTKRKKDGKDGKKTTKKIDLQAIAEAFVELLLSFFAENGAFLAILRHEARRGAQAAKIVADAIGPVFDGLVTRIDAMRATGEVRKDVDAKHLVMSCVAMVAFPFEEEPFVTAIWPANWHSKKFLAERKKHIVGMILARVLP